MLADDHDLSRSGCSGAPISHVIIDEVHERSCENDLLLLMFRTLLAKNKARTAATATTPAQPAAAAQAPRLKLILMSATLEVDTFTAYFGSAGLAVSTLSVAGRTFPVERHFLGDAVARSGYTCLPSPAGSNYYARHDVTHASISKPSGTGKSRVHTHTYIPHTARSTQHAARNTQHAACNTIRNTHMRTYTRAHTCTAKLT